VAGRALVLGGGGVTGVAWEVGLLLGLREAGVDLTGADLFVGTSAGSVVAAQVAAGLDLEQRFAVQTAGTGAELPARLRASTLLAFGVAMLRSRGPEAFRRRIGALALAAQTIPEQERRAVIADRLGVADWPDRPLRITAVDAHSGEFVVFDRDAGVGIVDAVAASCAVPGVWAPVSIDGRRFVDGGMRSPTNADLAGGYDRVVVVAPTTAGGGHMGRPAREVAELARTARTVLVSPDRAAREAIGRNVLDPARRPAAARAGRDQAGHAAAAVAAVWAP
jgi:NTE family protein